MQAKDTQGYGKTDQEESAIPIVSCDSSESKSTEYGRKAALKSNRFRCLILTLVLSLLFVVAEIGCIVHISASIRFLNSLKHDFKEETSTVATLYEVEQRRSEITWIPCGTEQTSNCSVLESSSSLSTLMKLMIGVKEQSTTRQNAINRYQTLHCKYFTMSSINNALEWQENLYNRNSRSDGHVNISESGVYGVYSIFTLSCPQTNETNTSSNIVHRINVNRLNDRNQTSSEVVFERSTVLRPDVQMYDTSEFFEFLHLNKGDVLFPTLSDTSFIYEMKQANVWGVFHVS